MSKIITEISAPVLNDSNFGNNLLEQFENINNNFKILASAEFMKGVEGKTIKLSEVPAFEKNTEGNYIFTLLGAKLFSAILSIPINENDSLNEIKTLIEVEEDSYKQWAKLSENAKYAVFDSFKSSDEYNGTINLYSYEDENGDDIYVYSPMNYFRDARIDELNDSESDVSYFSDASCSYIYDGKDFKTYTLYPTLYFNPTIGAICWKVNGEETSIAAQGLPGKDGNTCSVHILKCEVDSTANDLISIQATKYFYPSEWYDIDKAVSVINENEETKHKTISDVFKKTDLYFCIIFDNKNNVYDYTFANYPSIADNGDVKFVVDKSALIGRKSFINNFRDMVNNFNHDINGYPNAASLKGFYLPFSNDKKLVHSIYVSSENINNNEKSILNIDVESKDIYTNNDTDKNKEVIKNGSINIKNHDVNIQKGNLTVGGNIETSGNIKTTGLQVTVADAVHASFDNVEARILTDAINFTTEEMRITGASTYSVMEVNNFNKINIGNTNDGEEPDKLLTIRKDTEVNINGNVNIDSNVNITGEKGEVNMIDGMLQSEFMLPVGSIIMFGLEHTKIPNNWKICNGKSYYVNKQTGDIREKSNSGRPDTPLMPPPGYEEIKTPDLRGRFIVGANNSATEYNDTLSKYYFNAIVDGSNRGGKETVTLTANQSGLPTHSHAFSETLYKGSVEGDYLNFQTGKGMKNDKVEGTKSGLTINDCNSKNALEAHENRPPFYVLYYIMKLL